MYIIDPSLKAPTALSRPKSITRNTPSAEPGRFLGVTAYMHSFMDIVHDRYRSRSINNAITPRIIKGKLRTYITVLCAHDTHTSFISVSTSARMLACDSECSPVRDR